MKKVVYSVTKLGRTEQKISGIGYVTDQDLITACIGKNGKPCIRVFEDCLKDCFPVNENEFKGENAVTGNIEAADGYILDYLDKATSETEVYFHVAEEGNYYNHSFIDLIKKEIIL